MTSCLSLNDNLGLLIGDGTGLVLLRLDLDRYPSEEPLVGTIPSLSGVDGG